MQKIYPKTAAPDSGASNRFLFAFMVMVVLGLLITTVASAQRVYATVTPSWGRNQGTELVGGLIGNFSPTTNDQVARVTNPDAAGVGNESAFANLRVSSLNVLGLLTAYGHAWLQMKFPAPIEAGRTSFVRIDPVQHSGISLSTLDLLNLVGDALTVEAYAGATAGANGSLIPAAQVSSTLIRDLSGKYYLAVTSASAYNSVRVNLKFTSGLLGLSLGAAYDVNVYNAFTETTPPGDCGNPWATDEGAVSGLSVNLGVLKTLGISLGDVVNAPVNAIDASEVTASVITPGVLGVGASTSQTIFFNGGGDAGEGTRLLLSLPASLLEAGVAASISLQAFNGRTAVGPERTLGQALVDLDLLGLFASNARVPVYYYPGAAFDRITIRVNTLVGAGGNILGGGLNVHDVRRVPAVPEWSTPGGTAVSVCQGATTTLTVNARTGHSFRWFRAGSSTVLHTGTSYTPAATDLALGANEFEVAAVKDGCNNLSEKTKTIITVNRKALATDITLGDSIICAGESIVWRPASSIPGAVFRYYLDAQATQPVTTGVNTAGALTLSGLAAGTYTYYVSVSGTAVCENAAGTLKSVTVTVTAAPATPSVSASASTVAAGETAVLTASGGGAGATYRWFDAQSGGTLLFTGNPYVTPALSATRDFYVEAVNAGGCASTVRAQVRISVSGTASGAVPCEAASIDQGTGVSGVLAIGAGVTNKELAFDAFTTTGSTLVMPVGLAASVWQRVGFTGSSATGDTLELRIHGGEKLLSASVLPGISVTTFNSNVSNNDEVFVSGALVSLELLSGGREALVKLVPVQPFDAVELRLHSGLLGALTSLDFRAARRIIAAPVVTASAAQVCVGQATTISVSAPRAGIVYRWYDASGNYLSGQDGPVLNTGALTDTAVFFVEATRNGCTSARDSIVIPVIQAPNAPAPELAPVSVCSGGAAVLSVLNPSPGLTYRWYNAAGVYQTGKDGVTFTTAALTAATYFEVEAVNNCAAVSPRTRFNVNVGAINPPVVFAGSVTIMAGEFAILSATSSVAGAAIRWYDPAGIYQSGRDGNTFATPVLTTPGTFVYQVELAAGACVSTRVSVNVIVLPAAGSDPVPCLGASAEVNGTTGVVTVGAGVLNPERAIDNNKNSYALLSLPVGIAGEVFQRVSFAGLSAAGDTVELGISSQASLLALSALGSLEITTYNGTSSNNDAVSLNDPLVRVEILSGGSRATLRFVPAHTYTAVELRLKGGLLNLLGTVGLNYARTIPAAPLLNGGSTSVCEGNSITLSIQNPVAGRVYRWYRNNTYLSGMDGATLVTETNLPAGTYTYSVRALISGGCESNAAEKTVVVSAAPAAPAIDATTPATVCVGTGAALRVVEQAGLSYNWYDALGTVVATNTGVYNIPAGAAPGVYTYEVEARSSGGCAGARTSVSITVTRSGVPADITVSGAGTYCAGENITLTATSSLTGAQVKWYADAAGTNLLGTGNLVLNNLASGTYTYYASITANGVCENLAGALQEAVVSVRARATATDIEAAAQTLCGPGTASLSATSTTVAQPVFRWYADAALANLLFTGASFSTPVLTSNTTYYVTVSGSNRCENNAASAKAVSVTVNTLPATVEVDPDGTTACTGNATTLRVSNVQTGSTYAWFTAESGGIQLATGSSFTTPVLTTRTAYYVEARSGNCAGLRTRVEVQVVSRPPLPQVDATGTTICAGSPAVLNVAAPNALLVYRWYDAASGGNLLAEGVQFTSGVLTAPATYYVAAALATGCESSARTRVDVQVVALPLAPQVEGVENPLCIGASAELRVLNAVTGTQYRWFTAAVGGSPVADGAVFNTGALNTSTTFYVEGVNATGCVSTTRTAVAVPVDPGVGTPQPWVEQVTGNSIRFEWNAVDGATGYQVSMDNGTTFTQPDGGVMGRSFTATGLSPEQRVTIRVRAMGACGVGALSAEITGETDNPLGNQVFIPTAFSPNGDGRNDKFIVYGTQVASGRMLIFNQYGELIFETRNVQGAGWNGMAGGRAQPAGVYVYQVQLTMRDGSTQTKNGTVHLIR
ncbi:MAG: gliding motility-associated C-terminal domain-containing protein [Chitinophagaceae bacterium]